MSTDNPQRTGLAAAATALFIWGFLPLYFKVIGDGVSAWEILIHRALWAVPFLGLFIVLTRHSEAVKKVFHQPRVFFTLCLSATLITINWGTFIWASTNGHLLEASLGYYINPLLNVCLGVVFLHERLRFIQIIAVLIAAIGVLTLIIGYGQIPWIAFILAISFGSYALIRKQVEVDSTTGLFIETLVLAPFALIWIIWMALNGQAAFSTQGITTDLLLIGLGIVTVVPLVLFTVGAKRLRLGTLGLIQYITPTLQFLTGVFVFNELFTRQHAITFALIWLGLVIYTSDILYVQRRVVRKRRNALQQTSNRPNFTTPHDVPESDAPAAERT